MHTLAYVCACIHMRTYAYVCACLHIAGSPREGFAFTCIVTMHSFLRMKMTRNKDHNACSIRVCVCAIFLDGQECCQYACTDADCIPSSPHLHHRSQHSWAPSAPCTAEVLGALWALEGTACVSCRITLSCTPEAVLYQHCQSKRASAQNSQSNTGTVAWMNQELTLAGLELAAPVESLGTSTAHRKF